MTYVRCISVYRAGAAQDIILYVKMPDPVSLPPCPAATKPRATPSRSREPSCRPQAASAHEYAVERVLRRELRQEAPYLVRPQDDAPNFSAGGEPNLREQMPIQFYS
jgi:hypothetical protein